MTDQTRLIDELTEKEFSKWMCELRNIAARNSEIIAPDSHEYWFCYFDDGYSPEDAYHEDCSYD